MADLGTLALGDYTNVSNTSSTGSNPLLEIIASADDADFVFDNANSDHTSDCWFAISTTLPADLGHVDTLSINLRYGLSTTKGTNDWLSLRAQVFKSDGTTALTNQLTVVSSGTGISNTTPANSGATAFTGVDTAATKAEWQAAQVHILFEINRDGGGDSVVERVYAGELTGTYTGSTPFSADLTTPDFGMDANAVTRLNDYIVAATTASFTFAAQSLTRLNAWIGTLTAPTFNFTALDMIWTQATGFSADLTAAAFSFTAQAVDRFNDWIGTLSTPTFNFVAQSLERANAWIGALSTASMSLVAQTVNVALGESFILSTAVVNYTAQAVDTFTDFLVELGSASFDFTAGAITWLQDTVMTLTTGAFTFAAQILSFTFGGAVDLYEFIYYHPVTQACRRMWNRINGPGVPYE